VIDGSRGDNSARFLNRACTPNCEAVEAGERVFIHAVTAIKRGDELQRLPREQADERLSSPPIVPLLQSTNGIRKGDSSTIVDVGEAPL
jgi:hypothetical protein